MRLKNNINKSTKLMVLISFLIMVTTNALANILPLNGVNTGQVSDAYPNLFAPAGITFSIWGVIYLLLLMFVLYFIGFFNQERSKINPEIFNRIGIVFTISSIANTIWIFMWHWELLLPSIFVMLIILFSLIYINQTILNERLTSREKLFLKLPFSVYFGWITVASIANITTYLASINWLGFGLSEVTWTAVIIIVGLIIGGLTTVINKDIAYGLVLIWAYAGIFIKHISKSDFASQYPLVLVTVGVSIIVFVLIEVYVIFNKNSRVYN